MGKTESLISKNVVSLKFLEKGDKIYSHSLLPNKEDGIGFSLQVLVMEDAGPTLGFTGYRISKDGMLTNPKIEFVSDNKNHKVTCNMDTLSSMGNKYAEAYFLSCNYIFETIVRSVETKFRINETFNKGDFRKMTKNEIVAIKDMLDIFDEEDDKFKYAK